MKYSTHANLTVDLWRQAVEFVPEGMKTPLTRAIETTASEIEDESRLIPTIGGFVAVAAVYAVVPVLVVADGPLLFGDAIAAGLLAIPDPVIFAFGYNVTEWIID